jgi:hypothetical protein
MNEIVCAPFVIGFWVLGFGVYLNIIKSEFVELFLLSTGQMLT